ncbi:hypothetical protein ABK040_014441 [Willaertia magna]
MYSSCGNHCSAGGCLNNTSFVHKFTIKRKPIIKDVYPLHTAVKDNNIEKVKELIKQANLQPCFYSKSKVPKEQEEIPITTSANNEFIIVTNGEWEIEKEVFNINCLTVENQTALHFAVLNNNPEMIKLLLNYGANPNVRTYCNDGTTPLMLGVLEGKYEAIKMLVEYCLENNIPLKVDKTNYFKETPLLWASQKFMNLNKAEEIVTLLIEKGKANVNYPSCTNETPYNFFTHYTPVKFLTMIAKDDDNDNQELQKLMRVNNLFKKYGGNIELKRKEEKEPQKTYPPFIKDSYHKDFRMLEHEQKFGGALWSNGNLECFFLGKEPKVGLAMEIYCHFIEEFKKKKLPEFTWMRGIISWVSEDKKTFTATVRLNCDHEEILIDYLPGDWEVTIIWHPYKKYPWLTQKIEPLVNEENSYENLEKNAREMEKSNGREIIPRGMAERCTILKGVEDNYKAREYEPAPAIVTKIEMFPMYRKMIYHFEDEPKKEIGPSDVFDIMMRQLLLQNVDLLRKGKEAVPISIFMGDNVEYVDFIELVKGDPHGEILTPKRIGNHCYYCDKLHSRSHPLIRCPGCSQVFYCDANCQKLHWENHKKYCVHFGGRTLKVEENLSLIFKNLGNEFTKEKEFEKALECYDKAIEQDPINIIFYTNKAVVLNTLQRYEECIRIAERSVEIGTLHGASNEQIAKAYGVIGKAYQNQKKYAEAFEYFSKSLSEYNNEDIANRKKAMEKIIRNM